MAGHDPAQHLTPFRHRVIERFQNPLQGDRIHLELHPFFNRRRFDQNLGCAGLGIFRLQDPTIFVEADLPVIKNLSGGRHGDTCAIGIHKHRFDEVFLRSVYKIREAAVRLA